MTTIAIKPVDLPTMRSSLVDRLSAFRRAVRMRLLADGAARVLIEAVAMGLLSYLLDRWLRLSVPARLAYLAASVAVLIFETRRWVLLPLRLDLTPATLVAMLDARHPANGNGRQDLSQRVASVLEIPELVRRGHIASAAMAERAVARSYDSLRGVEFEHALDDRRHHRVLLAIAAGCFVPIVMTLAGPHAARLWFARFFLGSHEAWPQRTYIEIAGLSGGRIVVPRGEAYVLRVAAREGSRAPESVSLRYHAVSGRGAGGAASFTRFGPNDFRYEFPWVDEEQMIDVRGGDDVADPFLLRPVDRPKITRLELASQHPTQSAPEIHNFSGQDAGDVSFLPRTQMRLELSANVPVSDVKLDRATTRPAQPNLKRIDDRSFELTWTHETPMHLKIELVGAESGLVSLPTPVAIGLKQDQPPRVTLQHTGVRQRVTPQAKIPLTATARDDYGVAEMILAVRTERADPADPTKMSTEESNSPLAASTQPSATPEIVRQETFDVAARKLAPGAVLSLAATASDACYVGRQTAHSRTDTFRVVAPEELFKEILLRQQTERAKFRKTLEEAEKIRDALATLASPEVAAQLHQRHRVLQREVLRITNSLAESLTEMKLNVLGSPEAYDLMDRNILDPLKHLQSDLMMPQRAALEALGKAEDAPKLPDAMARQDQILTAMRAILKQMAQWDSFVDVINQLNEIIRLQEQVKQGTEELRKKQTDDVFEK